MGTENSNYRDEIKSEQDKSEGSTVTYSTEMDFLPFLKNELENLSKEQQESFQEAYKASSNTATLNFRRNLGH